MATQSSPVLGTPRAAADAQIRRRLPWTGDGGQDCFLIGAPNGRVARMADAAEAVQRELAEELLAHGSVLLAGEDLSREELRHLAGRSMDALRMMHRIARSRGELLQQQADLAALRN